MNTCFAYEIKTMQPLYAHQKLNTVCDLLFIEQKDSFSIQRLNGKKPFDEHTAQELLKLYGNLGGEISKYKTEVNLYLKKEELRQSCVDLASKMDNIVVNGFEVEMQATWLEKKREAGEDITGYKYEKGSMSPKKHTPSK